MATAATWTPGAAERARSRRSSSRTQRDPRDPRKASATGPRSHSWQTLRMSGPRTSQAGRAPASPWSGLVATLASPSSVPSASGTAKAGSFWPTGGPVELASSSAPVVSVLISTTARKSTSTTPMNHP
jgi:hypothetical protein